MYVLQTGDVYPTRMLCCWSLEEKTFVKQSLSTVLEIWPNFYALLMRDFAMLFVGGGGGKV